MNPFIEAKVTRADAERFNEIAATWNILQNHLDSLGESELAKLLKWEMSAQRRMYVVNRIKSRHTRIRDARERHEIFSEM